MQFKKTNDPKEALGIGYRKVDVTFEIDLDMNMSEEQIEKLQDHLSKFDYENAQRWDHDEQDFSDEESVFTKGYDWNVNIVRHFDVSELDINVVGMLMSNTDPTDLEDSLYDVIFQLDFINEMAYIADGRLFVEHAIAEDQDLVYVLDTYENSLTKLTLDEISRIEEIYTEGYKPSVDLEKRMYQMAGMQYARICVDDCIIKVIGDFRIIVNAGGQTVEVNVPEQGELNIM
jgi:hypothetical protein